MSFSWPLAACCLRLVACGLMLFSFFIFQFQVVPEARGSASSIPGDRHQSNSTMYSFAK
jgi:hypothetical protein